MRDRTVGGIRQRYRQWDAVEAGFHRRERHDLQKRPVFLNSNAVRKSVRLIPEVGALLMDATQLADIRVPSAAKTKEQPQRSGQPELPDSTAQGVAVGSVSPRHLGASPPGQARRFLAGTPARPRPPPMRIRRRRAEQLGLEPFSPRRTLRPSSAGPDVQTNTD